MDFLDELKFLKEQLSFRETIKDIDYEQVVIAGMGSSGIAGKIFQEMYTEKPTYLVDDYRIPKFVRSKDPVHSDKLLRKHRRNADRHCRGERSAEPACRR